MPTSTIYPFPPLPTTCTKPKDFLVQINKHILHLWNSEWDAHLTTGQWTKHLLPQAHAHPYPTTFWTTQILTGHGLFQSYLYKHKRSESPACPHCQHPEDTAQHALYHCTLHADKRPPLDQLTPANAQFRYFATLVMRSRWHYEAQAIKEPQFHTPLKQLPPPNT